MAKVSYNVVVDLLTGALDSKKAGQMTGHRLVSRRPRKAGGDHQMYFMKIHEGEWAEGAVKNREKTSAAMRKAHAIENAAKNPAKYPAELVAEATKWQEEYDTYRAGLKPGEPGYGSLYSFAYAQIYRKMKEGWGIGDTH